MTLLINSFLPFGLHAKWSLGGLLISLIPGTPRVGISPDLIFLIFLPPLLYEAAWYTSWPNFRKFRWPILLHGFGLVIVTSVIIAYLSEKLIPRFTLPIGLLLGGIISPPDAVAASSVLKFFKIPKKVKTVLEGESLVNDAASLTIFRFALAAVISGTVVMEEAATSFVVVTIMGIVIGSVIANIVYFIYKLLPTTPSIDTAISLVSPYLMYLTAEHFHFSGVLAVVSGGLFLSSCSHNIFSYGSRLQTNSVWSALVFMLNGVVFILIGLQLPDIVKGLGQYALRDAIFYGVVISLVTIIIRIMWVYPAAYVPWLLSKRIRKRETRPTWQGVFIVGWSGMRGVVSLASALAVPTVLTNETIFPHRNLILFITFIVILFTLVLQGLSLPLVIRFVFDFSVRFRSSLIN
jgi:CPA1 family monovalent cation:H+ antiporter